MKEVRRRVQVINLMKSDPLHGVFQLIVEAESVLKVSLLQRNESAKLISEAKECTGF